MDKSRAGNFFYVACRPCCESEILAIKQVAEYLKITARSIYGLATAKKISAFEVVGTLVLFRWPRSTTRSRSTRWRAWTRCEIRLATAEQIQDREK
ncbi:hypothetical protein CTI10_027105 [Delftia acidovorans]|nr:hypothetical protein CTI10_027105 [Delftia acidovorans]